MFSGVILKIDVVDVSFEQPVGSLCFPLIQSMV